MAQNVEDLRRVVEGLTVMQNHQNGRVPLSVPPNGYMAPGGNVAYSTVPSNVNPGTQPGMQAKSNIKITMTQQELEDLLAVIIRTLGSEITERRPQNSSDTRDVNGATAVGPQREEAEPGEPSAPPIPREREEQCSEDSVMDILCCDVCGLQYNKDERKPIILPDCGHTFCRRCVITASRNRNLRCPTCRREYRVPAESLPPNYTVLSLVAEVNSAAAVNGTPSAITDPSRMHYDEQLEQALKLSLKEYEEEQSLRLAQELQEEENAKAMTKGKKDKASKLHAWQTEDWDDEDQPFPRRQNSRREEGGQDAMNAYYSARRLMEEEEEELDPGVPYRQQHESVQEDEGSGSDEDAHSWGESYSLRGYIDDVGTELHTPAESTNNVQRESHSHRESMTDVGRESYTSEDSTYSVQRSSCTPGESMHEDQREPQMPRESMDNNQRAPYTRGENIHERRECYTPRESMENVRRDSFTPGENMSNAGRASWEGINDVERESLTQGESMYHIQAGSHAPGETRNNMGREAHSPKDSIDSPRGASCAKQSCKKLKEGSMELPPMEKDLEHYMNTHFYGKDGRKGKSSSLDEETRSMLARALEREQQEREDTHKRKTRRLLKEQEQLELAYALSLSMQDTGKNDDSDKEEKEDENEE
ncbi:cilia- and flagella-associated protein 251-like [Penaeus chinensis]|uniref:cilia- and flagella-associated protein 251-like n=1 Tax=Penaeus chinensis TaxID=139456 RepID=UPI001FB64223|nr:cilia- and flagella-associated protein 251-like [Penaeus chinensis]